MSLDENAFGMSAFHEIGPGKHFLGSQHTLANYETAFYDFELADNNSFEQWSADGSLDQLVRANKRWKAMLESYEAPLLDPAKDEELREYIQRRKASMPDDIV
jgi:trimethylamine--corrinoid protein Co-methyltransferase